MTIKRRLFLSNMLMLIIPIILSVIMFSSAFFLFVSMAGMDVHAIRGGPPPPQYAEGELVDYFSLAGRLLLVIAIVMVFVTNRVLTHFITKRITTPISLLSSGVHELRDGNLRFRIEYGYNDEFKPVCDDFNEMAQRLHDMVTARQKDEKSRRELIAGISHDLRTPLTSIKAYVEGIEKGIASTAQAQDKYISTIKSKADDMEHIINQLFLFSKLDIGEFPLKEERVEMNETLRDFLSDAAGEYESKGLSVMLSENPKRLYASVDVLQLRNVLHNILGNSVKYKREHDAASTIVCGETSDSVLITVTDNGPGVSPHCIDKLFDVFYRDDASRKDPGSGSGLGLAIASKTIERLGGSIAAENPPGGGLAIVITLPKA